MGDKNKPVDDTERRDRATLGTGYGGYDASLYGGNDRSAYNQEIVDGDDDDDMDISGGIRNGNSERIAGRNNIGDNDDREIDMREYSERYGSGINNSKIVDKESSYMARRHQRNTLSPTRSDAFSGETPARSYADIMTEQQLAKEEAKVRKAIASGDVKSIDSSNVTGGAKTVSVTSSSGAPERRRRRWDDAGGVDATPVVKVASEWDQSSNAMAMPVKSETVRPARSSRWDETPLAAVASIGGGGGGWDVGATPRTAISGVEATPVAGDVVKKRSRWDDTPLSAATAPGMSSIYGATPAMFGMTPSSIMSTPSIVAQSEIISSQRVDADIDERNQYMTDEELDSILPATGYKILIPPASYVPIRSNLHKLLTTPTPVSQTPGFSINLHSAPKDSYAIPLQGDSDLPPVKPEDMQYFSKLLDDVDEERLSPEEHRERRIMKLLLNIKNGTPPQRKVAMRQITDKAKEFGAAGLFNQILPLLNSVALDEQERHLLVKVIDRVLNQLGELVRPFAHKIIVVVGPMLVETDYVTKVVGRQVMSQLTKAAGLACMIQAMRPDIDHKEEFVRNTTARCFASVASALGIPQILPFLQACCQIKKSWEGRHTGIKIVQQIAILMGSAILPHLKMLVNITEHGLVDENQKVRTITGLAMSALAEAAYPYGIEAFDSVINPLWKGIKLHRSQNMSAFLKAVGHIIPLMEPEHAAYFTKEAMVVCIREFANTDEAVKKIVLIVVEKCVSTDGVQASYIKDTIMPEFFKHFWTKRMALDRKNYSQVVKTTVEIAKKVGAAEVISRLVPDLKDDSEQYRKMVVSTMEEIIKYSGCADIEPRLEELLMDGMLYAFQDQNMDDSSEIILRGFGVIVNSLGERMKPYLAQIAGMIKARLNNKNAKIRMQSADLVSKIAYVMSICKEDKLMGHLGVVLFEYLGEEYPEVLGSILGALKAIVNVIGMTRMTPPIKDLLPRLTPILKNRHEKVQENCIDLVGRIADRGAEFVATKEWTRICFELLEMLKANKKSIRRAAVNTFGYIAKAIGPHEVLHPLLNNLKVQDRQMRVCTTVAIAIVSETCSPFTVLPALMNEYRIPDMNVQNGVLKALSFMFEYIGEMAKDYIYAVSPLLEDAFMDREIVHRQLAANSVKHLALGVVGRGCEDALVHLLNYLWPNILEITDSHILKAVMEGIEGCIVALGPGRMMAYLLQGLYHPARRVRDVYWKIFNSVYIFAQDGLVPYYPRLEDDLDNSYTRHHLELIL